MTLEELKEKVIEFRNRRDWKKFHSPKDLAISLVLEATEVLEHFQWKDQKEQDKYVKNHKENIADELGDVLHNILLIADEFKIDLEKAFLAKMRKNEKKYPVRKSKGKNKKWTEL